MKTCGFSRALPLNFKTSTNRHAAPLELPNAVQCIHMWHGRAPKSLRAGGAPKKRGSAKTSRPQTPSPKQQQQQQQQQQQKKQQHKALPGNAVTKGGRTSSSDNSSSSSSRSTKMLPIANSSLMAGVSTVSLYKYRRKESMRFGKNILKGKN